MDEDDEFLGQVLEGIDESDIISIFFPLLRRALVVDTRNDHETGQFIKVMPQVGSMEQRIMTIERLRPKLGKVRSILGIPWIKSVRALEEEGIAERLEARLTESGMPRAAARSAVKAALSHLWRLESMAFVKMIRGEGYKTIWTATAK